MQIYHQCGHNFVWNKQSIQDDGVGEGLIISPVNIDADQLRKRIPDEILELSWLDPQFYRPKHKKGFLKTYPFFPGNVMDEFNTSDFSDHADEVANQCLEFQNGHGLKYLVIPSR